MTDSAFDLSSFENRIIDSCESTNDLARVLGEAGYPSGTWVSAREQTRGRGRQGRVWRGLPGNLFLSMVVRLPDLSLWTWLPLMAAVCAAQAAGRGRLSIKWPNDLFLEGAKAGGILCEGVSGPSGQFIVIGLGVNCGSTPDGLDQKTESLDWVEVDAYRNAVISELRQGIDRLKREGSDWIRDVYESCAVFEPGSWVEWSEHTGTVIGLGPSGELRVMDSAEGEERALFAEDVRVRLKP